MSATKLSHSFSEYFLDHAPFLQTNSQVLLFPFCFLPLLDPVATVDVQLLQLHIAEEIFADAAHEDTQRREAAQM